MAIKITYIFLKTLCITLGVELLACDGFLFNANTPIKAFKRAYFVKKDGEIKIEVFDKEIKQQFCLPKKLDSSIFSKEIEPLYILPAV